MDIIPQKNQLRPLQPGENLILKKINIAGRTIAVYQREIPMYGNQMIRIWRGFYLYPFRRYFDCSGFALDSWRRFGYTVALQDVVYVLQQEFDEMVSTQNLESMDLIVLFDASDEPFHLARVVEPAETLDQIQVISKYGLEQIQVESYQQMFQTYNDHLKKTEAADLSVKFYREKDISNQPKLFDLFDMQKWISLYRPVSEYIPYSVWRDPATKKCNFMW